MHPLGDSTMECRYMTVSVSHHRFICLSRQFVQYIHLLSFTVCGASAAFDDMGDAALLRGRRLYCALFKGFRLLYARACTCASVKT